jgi:hypothetical protein
LDSTEDAWLGDDAAYLNVKKFLIEPGRVCKHILSNDLPMLGVVAGHKYGVVGDSFSQDTEVAPVHMLEFKSGSKPIGLRATEVEPACPVHHLILLLTTSSLYQAWFKTLREDANFVGPYPDNALASDIFQVNLQVAALHVLLQLHLVHLGIGQACVWQPWRWEGDGVQSAPDTRQASRGVDGRSLRLHRSRP